MTTIVRAAEFAPAAGAMTLAGPVDVGGVLQSALFDQAGTYRYALVRKWAADDAGKHIVWIMLNPSTADHATDDPTIRRVTQFSKREGASRMTVVNLFALRSTDPKALLAHPDPIGPGNPEIVLHEALNADLVICAWGRHGSIRDQDIRMVSAMEACGLRPQCLKLTATGAPGHPLYIRGDAPLLPFDLR